MDLKPGVIWPEDMSAASWYMRGVINQVHWELFGYVATCTSAYRAGDPRLHGKKRALDVRIKHLTDAQVHQLVAMLKSRLGPDFDVVLEGPLSLDPALKSKPPHIHAEYDPQVPA